LNDSNQKIKTLAHDIRGPLGGIITLTEIITNQGEKNRMAEILNFIEMIHHAGSSLLDLAIEIMNTEINKSEQVQKDELNLVLFKEKLEKLFALQVKNKNIHFIILINNANSHIPFLKNKLLQIANNLISNAIKFSSEFGEVIVEMDLFIEDDSKNIFTLIVHDNGIGMNAKDILDVLNGGMNSTLGTYGEKGYGLGLKLVKNLTDSLDGTLQINSKVGNGSSFIVKIPVKK
jgi:signal transduction histidine kinase